MLPASGFACVDEVGTLYLNLYRYRYVDIDRYR